MEKKQIMVLCDSEETFLRRLADHMNGKQGFPFRVHPFTDVQAAAAFMEEQETALYLGPDISAFSDGKRIRAGKVLFFSREKAGRTDGETTILKYQSAEDLVRSVLEACAGSGGQEGSRTDRISHSEEGYSQERRIFGLPDETRHGEQPDDVLQCRQGRTCITCVYSPVGRCGKTGFAVALGEALAASSRVLYLSLEEFSWIGRLRKEEGAADLTDLIYYLREDPDSIPLRLAGVTRALRRMDYIPPAAFAADLMEAGPMEWRRLVWILAMTQEYDHLILDLDGRCEMALALLPLCRRIYMPSMETQSAQCKVEQFLDTLSAVGLEQVRKEIRTVRPPAWELEEKGTDPVRTLLKGSMGEYVRKMLKSGRERSTQDPFML